MKQLETHNREKNFPVQVREVRKTKQVASFHPHKGHTCFEFNTKTGEIKPATIQQVNADIKGGIKKKIIMQENCLYTSALNIVNAQKKFFHHLRTSCA